jgi:hypothetical protein
MARDECAPSSRGRFRLSARSLVALVMGPCIPGVFCDPVIPQQPPELICLDDSASDVRRFEGIWDVYLTDDPVRHAARLICDETGDPRELQVFGDSDYGILPEAVVIAASSDCRILHGSPAPASCQHLDGRLYDSGDDRGYCASARAWQEGSDRLRVVVEIQVQGARGEVQTTTLEFDLAFAADGTEAADWSGLFDGSGFTPSGMIIDAARGTMTATLSSDAGQSRSYGVILFRSFFY